MSFSNFDELNLFSNIKRMFNFKLRYRWYIPIKLILSLMFVIPLIICYSLVYLVCYFFIIIKFLYDILPFIIKVVFFIPSLSLIISYYATVYGFTILGLVAYGINYVLINWIICPFDMTEYEIMRQKEKVIIETPKLEVIEEYTPILEVKEEHKEEKPKFTKNIDG